MECAKRLTGQDFERHPRIRPEQAILAGGDASLLKTTDGGTSWTPYDLGTSYQSSAVPGLSSSDANHGWAAGHDGEVLPTTIAPNTWTVEPPGVFRDVGV
ncbi:hypothetical protein D6833_12360, partial [Candidatus Parcubacteria bacterium]